MGTLTASLLNANVKAVHTGIIAVGAAITASATLTASSVILLNFVPDGATLVDWWLRYTDNAATQSVELGTSFSPSGIAAQFSLTITFSTSDSIVQPGMIGMQNQFAYRAPIGGGLMPVRISISDDVQPQQVRLQLTTRLAISASCALLWMLFYTMDGLDGHTTIR